MMSMGAAKGAGDERRGPVAIDVEGLALMPQGQRRDPRGIARCQQQV